MKTISMIAKESGVPKNYVHKIIVRDGIKLIKQKNNNFMLVDKYQEDYIHSVLYFERKIDELTIESKMNKL